MRFNADEGFHPLTFRFLQNERASTRMKAFILGLSAFFKNDRARKRSFRSCTCRLSKMRFNADEDFYPLTFCFLQKGKSVNADEGFHPSTLVGFSFQSHCTSREGPQNRRLLCIYVLYDFLSGSSEHSMTFALPASPHLRGDKVHTRLQDN